MIDLPFQQTPLFHLNLFLWLSLPVFDGKTKAVFWKNGYRAYLIGPSLPAPPEASVRFSKTNERQRLGTVNPDLLLRNDNQQDFLPLECKLSSFGPTVDQSKQALSLLTCTGSYLADYFGLTQTDSWRAVLLYAVSHPQQDAMLETLGVLATKLRDLHIETSPFSSLGISVNEDGVYLHFARPEQMPFSVSTREKVMKLDPGEDPRPLYLLPLDPSISAQDEYGKRAIQERLRSALASLIGSQLQKKSIRLTWDELMVAAIEIWPLWKDRNSTRNLRNQAKQYARRILSEIGRLEVEIEYTQNGFIIRSIDHTSGQSIQRYFKGRAYRQGELDLWQEGVQLRFEDIPDKE